VLEKQNEELRAVIKASEAGAVREEMCAMRQETCSVEHNLTALQAAVCELRAGLTMCTSTCADLQVVVGTTERVAASVQCEVDRARRESGAAAAALARDAAVLAEDARIMRVWAKQLEHTVEERGLSLRTSSGGGLLAGSNCKNHCTDAVEGLSKKVALVIQQQARHARSVEEIVKALMGDSTQLAKQARALGNDVGSLRQCAAEHHEALLRACQVFATSLKIPSPLASSLNLAAPVANRSSSASSATGTVPLQSAPLGTRIET